MSEILNEIDENKNENEIENENNKENEEVAIDDILIACGGTDEYGNSMAGFSLDIGLFNPTTDAFDIKNSTVYCNPEIAITRVGVTTMIDFIFDTRTDAELRQIWAFLQKYGKDVEDAFRNGAKNIPFLRFQIVPIVYSGKYAVNAYSPIYWGLQPQSPMGEINVIRTAFEAESVIITESESYNEEEIAAQIEREEIQKEHIIESYEQKKQEEEEYQKERQAMMEELRKNKDLD